MSPARADPLDGRAHCDDHEFWSNGHGHRNRSHIERDVGVPKVMMFEEQLSMARQSVAALNRSLLLRPVRCIAFSKKLAAQSLKLANASLESSRSHQALSWA